ncbi:hypothetical protein QYE76_043013 [Lolium multiflorum]|uniref:Reverse transcriptase domain-containing protein n=1 Tax=Lolium multiflorum TaxID=4521 RepID=A0AAD8TGF9_LOLMU|nr:hypothetical protein QYE76_043013 [Lolium multiflorum]
MNKLQSWSKTNFGSVAREVEKSRTRLEELMAMNADKQEIREVTDKMNEMLYREEMMWLQRSRISWLKEGDRNTRYFHRHAVWRARKNKIKGLEDSDGNWHTDTGEMRNLATDYFRHLFTADQSIDPPLIVNLFEEKVTVEMNEGLCADFTDKEIGDALFQIGPLKAPGLDGFPARFFQRNWGVLQGEITAAVKLFFETGVMPAGINDTALVLIPKLDDPRRMSEFRPISLCNVVYKVVSKCLVNRLRPILGDIISEEQSAFVPGLQRDIFDLFLPEFDKPWVIHLRETCCCSTNLCSWRPNTVYKNRSTRRHQGSEWVLHLLHGKTELERLRIMMLLWRIWHVRNEVVHHKPPPPAEASRRFLCSYVDSLLTIKYYPHDDGVKGKAPADQHVISKEARYHVAAGPSAAKERWT